MIPQSIDEIGIIILENIDNFDALLKNQYIHYRTEYLVIIEKKWAIDARAVVIKPTTTINGFVRKITHYEILANEDETKIILDKQLNVMSRPKLYRLARNYDKKCIIFKGLHDYVNFIIQDEQVIPKLMVFDIVPPPSCIAFLVQQIIDHGLVNQIFDIGYEFFDICSFLESILSDKKYQTIDGIILPCKAILDYITPQVPITSVDSNLTTFLKKYKKVLVIGCRSTIEVLKAFNVNYIFKSICPYELTHKKRQKIPILTRCCIASNVGYRGNYYFLKWLPNIADVKLAIETLCSKDTLWYTKMDFTEDYRKVRK